MQIIMIFMNFDFIFKIGWFHSAKILTAVPFQFCYAISVCRLCCCHDVLICLSYHY